MQMSSVQKKSRKSRKIVPMSRNNFKVVGSYDIVQVYSTKHSNVVYSQCTNESHLQH